MATEGHRIMYDSINVLIGQIMPVALATGDWDEALTVGDTPESMTFVARWRNVIVLGKGNEVRVIVEPDEITASGGIQRTRETTEQGLPALRMLAHLAGAPVPGDLVHVGTSLVSAPATVPAAWADQA